MFNQLQYDGEYYIEVEENHFLKAGGSKRNTSSLKIVCVPVTAPEVLEAAR